MAAVWAWALPMRPGIEKLSTTPSTRLVVRQITELSLVRGRLWLEATGLDRLDCMLFGVMLAASMAHRPYRDDDGWCGLYADPAMQRPFSALAISRSIGLSYETTRRRLRALTEMGVVEPRGAGMVVTAAFQQRVWQTDVVARDIQALASMVMRLADHGYAPAIELASQLPLSIPPDVQARMVLDFTQRTLEPMLEQFGDLMTGTVAAAIVAANVRHITLDRALSRRYAAADAPPPDGQRRPVAIRALARDLDLPFETVRRRVGALSRQGLALLSDDGVVVPSATLSGPLYIRTNMSLAAQVERLLRDLSRL